MKDTKRFITIAAIVAVSLSILLYLLHYVIFGDWHHIFIYLLGDFAFLPLEVFLVVIVIERILDKREKSALLEKMNMVVGAFYSEIGNGMMRTLLPIFDNNSEICQRINVGANWTSVDYKEAAEYVSALNISPNYKKIDFPQLKKTLLGHRQFMLTLLENPNLLEKDEFTDLLFSTFHLTEELEARDSFVNLPTADLEHLSIDVKRMYQHLLLQWLIHVERLKSDYPYIHSLVMRTHPFQEKPQATFD
jgi:hypothetical protein